MWCYTTDASKSWDLCDLPVCEEGETNCIHGICRACPNKFIQHVFLYDSDNKDGEGKDNFVSEMLFVMVNFNYGVLQINFL